MVYCIDKILNRDGSNPDDPAAIDRMGRVVDVEPEEIIIGDKLFMNCIRPGFLKSIITSFVERVYENDNGMLVIETENSMYYLKPVGGDW